MRSHRLRLALVVLVAAFAWSGCSNDRGSQPVGLETTGFESDGNTGAKFAIPAGYYDTVDMSNPTVFRATLHEVIDDHLRYPYTASSTDTWDILEMASEDPSDPSRILDIYKNASYTKQGGGNTFYNREHTWPKSYGFPDDGSSNYPYTDCHQLFLCDDSYNTSRSNKPFRNCNSGCLEKPTNANNGVGGGTGTYPGNSNWTSGSFTDGTWEVWNDRRGDVARALLYLDIRYEGGTHGSTGGGEPDLILTDNEALIAASNTGSNELVAYMGMLTVLLQWHVQDPVDDKERTRNDVVFGFQGNRNPFVDHPEWVDCIYNGNCGTGDTTPPAVPAGLGASSGNGIVVLDWADNVESDLAGYHIYRATSSVGPFFRLNPATLTASEYNDTSVTNNVTYWYRVTSIDLSDNESANSAAVTATPQGGGNPIDVAWINEFHYDNSGADTGEFYEIAGTAGLDLSGWTLVGYNGNGGIPYITKNLAGTLPDQQNGFGTLAFDFVGMQNGGPDGLALVNDGGEVVEFLSYEGTMVAVGGPADGLASTDVGVSETSSTPIGHSLQRTGTGGIGSEFTWAAPSPNTSGQPNTGQTFEGDPGDTTPPDAPTALATTSIYGSVNLDWANNIEPDLAGYSVWRGTAPGGPYTEITGALLTTSAYVDDTGIDGTLYYYVVRAEDVLGNESGDSIEESGTSKAAPGDTVVWINELHYDNDGTDLNEFVEVAGPVGTSLAGWTLVGYNGQDGTTYDTVPLSGSLPRQQDGYGTRAYAFANLQNGNPDAIALVDANGNVVEFLSYEGIVTASDGPAWGLTATDVEVNEGFGTASNESLQRVGTGSQASDFTWATPMRQTAGSVNTGQTLGSGENTGDGGPRGIEVAVP